MAHEIRTAYMARPAWHGLGIIRPGYSFRDAAAAEETDYTVTKVRTFMREDDPQADYVPLGSYALVPQGSNIGGFEATGVVSEHYHVVQPKEIRLYAADLVDGLKNAGIDASAETSLVLRNGRDVVHCVRVGQCTTVEQWDSYITLHNPYDGKTALGISAATVAVVCANTLQAAQRAHVHRIRHGRDIREDIEASLQIIVGAAVSAEAYGERMLPLVHTKLEAYGQNVAIRRMAEIVTGIDDEQLGLIRDDYQRSLMARRRDRTEARIRERYDAPQGQGEARQGTAYGVLQATIDAVEHSGRKERLSGGRLLRAIQGGDAQLHESLEAELLALV